MDIGSSFLFPVQIADLLAFKTLFILIHSPRDVHFWKSHEFYSKYDMWFKDATINIVWCGAYAITIF